MKLPTPQRQRSVTTSLLENLYNAPWPKNFDASSFFLDEDLTPVTRSSQIGTLDEEMQRDMGKALLECNEHLKRTEFYSTYLFPIQNHLNQK